jgi:predicted acylesterase/phospholipase RssA
MPDARGNRHAVVLSGGGAYGAYEVGVLKAMLTGQMPQTGYTAIDPDIYTGTSVGAINAAVLVSQDGAGVRGAEAADFLEAAWADTIAESLETCRNGAYRLRADPTHYLSPRCLRDPARALTELTEDGAFLAETLVARTANFFRSAGSLTTRALEFVDVSAFVSSEPIGRLVRQLVSLEAVRRSGKALRVVAANWATGEVKTFENKHMTDDDGHQAVLASAAIPGFFPPQYIAGEPYVDGGVVMNTPLRCAIDAGADFLHIVYLDPDIDQLPLKVLESTYSTMDRTIVIHNATVINEDVDTASWINAGLTAMEKALQGEELSGTHLRDFVRVASQIAERLEQAGKPYRKLTIHRYHPHRDPGRGGIGILDFNRDRMLGLIELGFDDTVHHDCNESHCIRPYLNAPSP